MKKGDRNLLIAGALIAICVFGYTQGWFAGLIPASVKPPDYTPTDTDKDNYAKGIGRWNVLETVADSLDPAVIRTSATNYKLYWYGRQGSSWTYLETGNNKYVTLTPNNGGYLWVFMEIPSGQAFYVDYQKIMTGNGGYVKEYLYADVTGDGVKEFGFKYDMHGLPIPNSGYPSITFMGYILTYEASLTGLNDLVNDTAIGTSTNTQYYDYYLSFAAAKKGIAIWKIEVKIGTTDESKVRLKKLNVPGLGYLDGSLFTKVYTATDYRYTYTISNTFDGADYITYPSNAQNRFDMTLGLEYTLVHPDDILITTTVYYLIAQTEASTSTSDTFYAQE